MDIEIVRLAADAEREAQLGDMDEALLKGFLDSLR